MLLFSQNHSEGVTNKAGITVRYTEYIYIYIYVYIYIYIHTHTAYRVIQEKIGKYFERVFKTRPVHSRFVSIYDDIQDDINNEQFNLFQAVPLKADGTPDMRYAVSKRFMDFKVWQDPLIRERCSRIAAEIRHDIEVCLSTGKLPLRGSEGATVSRKTRKLRSELVGLNPNRLFYASGQLIRHLNVYVEIGEKVA
jgi:hypothetical protein